MSIYDLSQLLLKSGYKRPRIRKLLKLYKQHGYIDVRLYDGAIWHIMTVGEGD